REVQTDSELVRPPWTRSGVYYLESWIEVPAHTDAVVSLRAFGRARIWVDGELVLDRDALDADVATDTSRLITLEAGRHRVLMKYGVSSGDQGMQLFVVPTGGAPRVVMTP